MALILLIEDDPDIRETTLEFLEMIGHMGLAFSDGDAALAYLTDLDSELPSLILTDLNMPKMDGPTFRAAQLRLPRLRDIPCVVLSADIRIESRFENLHLSGVVKKPIDLDELERTINKFINQRAYVGSHVPSAPSGSVTVETAAAPTDVSKTLKVWHDLINEIGAAKMHAEVAVACENLPERARTHLLRVDAKLEEALRLIRQESEKFSAITQKSTETERSTRSLRNKILLLDDSADLRSLFTTYLNPRGFQVTTAANVNEAFEQIAQHGFPDLLLIDLHLGSMTAHVALDQLEKIYPAFATQTKIVLFTAAAQGTPDTRIHATETKSLSLNAIENVVRKHL